MLNETSAHVTDKCTTGGANALTRLVTLKSQFCYGMRRAYSGHSHSEISSYF